MGTRGSTMGARMGTRGSRGRNCNESASNPERPQFRVTIFVTSFVSRVTHLPWCLSLSPGLLFFLLRCPPFVVILCHLLARGAPALRLPLVSMKLALVVWMLAFMAKLYTILYLCAGRGASVSRGW
jgi:hypothetical protein